jgi:hypothetical protein
VQDANVAAGDGPKKGGDQKIQGDVGGPHGKGGDTFIVGDSYNADAK